MSKHKGKAWSVFPTQERNGTRAVTQIIVRPTDPDTLRYTKDLIAQQEPVVPAFPPDPEVSFYISREGPQPAPGDDLAWGANHVTWTDSQGKPRIVDKLEADFWPGAPLH